MELRDVEIYVGGAARCGVIYLFKSRGAVPVGVIKDKVVSWAVVNESDRGTDGSAHDQDAVTRWRDPRTGRTVGQIKFTLVR